MTERFVDLGLQLRLPLTVDFEVSDWNGYDLAIQAELIDGRYQLVNLVMTRRCDTDAPVPDLPIAPLVTAGVFDVALKCAGGKPQPRDGLPTRDELAEIARFYKMAVAVGEPPRKTVADLYGCSLSTAGRWVGMAREAGILDKVSMGAGSGRRRGAFK